MTPAPSSLGYRLPAEWEPHEATWLNWPNFTGVSFSDYQDHDHLEEVFVEIVRSLVPGEEVWINTNSESDSKRVKGLFREGEVRCLRFFEIPTKEPWLRDFGGSFVVAPGRPDPKAIVDWQFNGWGGRYLPAEPENLVPAELARRCRFPIFETEFVLEGGAIEVNGRGTLLATESCVINDNRNPGLEKEHVERVMRENLGIHHFIWLEDGLAWDDLDGHIDAVARFAPDQKILAAAENDSTDANYDSLRANLDQLAKARDERGNRFEIVPLPMPAPIYFLNERPPASYANFYVGNTAVLVPSFDDANDDVACERLQEVFPDRNIIPIDCRQVIRDLGALHCLLMNVPESEISAGGD